GSQSTPVPGRAAPRAAISASLRRDGSTSQYPRRDVDREEQEHPYEAHEVPVRRHVLHGHVPALLPRARQSAVQQLEDHEEAERDVREVESRDREEERRVSVGSRRKGLSTPLRGLDYQEGDPREKDHGQKVREQPIATAPRDPLGEP